MTITDEDRSRRYPDEVDDDAERMSGDRERVGSGQHETQASVERSRSGEGLGSGRADAVSHPAGVDIDYEGSER